MANILELVGQEVKHLEDTNTFKYEVARRPTGRVSLWRKKLLCSHRNYSAFFNHPESKGPFAGIRIRTLCVCVLCGAGYTFDLKKDFKVSWHGRYHFVFSCWAAN